MCPTFPQPYEGTPRPTISIKAKAILRSLFVTFVTSSVNEMLERNDILPHLCAVNRSTSRKCREGDPVPVATWPQIKSQSRGPLQLLRGQRPLPDLPSFRVVVCLQTQARQNAL